MVEWTAAVLLLLVLSPLLVVVAVVVVATSGRPVLFCQERVGRGGERFVIWKFRTMVRDAEALGDGYVPEGTNLITPVGSILRRSSLDELPQLLNIVRRDMVFIGPRPTMQDQYDRYTAAQRERVDVLPGVTGLAQVTYRDNAPWSKRIELDRHYIANVGPRLDLKIIAMTVRMVISGDDISPFHTIDDIDDLGSRSKNVGSVGAPRHG